MSSAATPPVRRDDDAVLPRDGPRIVESGLAHRHADRVKPMRIGERGKRVGGVNERLRGNAADVETGPTEPVGFDEDGVDPELAGANRGDIAAGSAADDQGFAGKFVHGPPVELLGFDE